MTLMVNGKKVLGYALGDNEYLSGENLNAFYIDMTQYDSDVNPNSARSFTIDMTNYFKKADTKHLDVQYYQIMLFLDYTDNSDTSDRATFITSLLKRGAINNKRSVTTDNGPGGIAWFTDENTLAISVKSVYDEGLYTFTGWFAEVYGFTSQDVGSVS